MNASSRVATVCFLISPNDHLKHYLFVPSCPQIEEQVASHNSDIVVVGNSHQLSELDSLGIDTSSITLQEVVAVPAPPDPDVEVRSDNVLPRTHCHAVIIL